LTNYIQIHVNITNLCEPLQLHTEYGFVRKNLANYIQMHEKINLCESLQSHTEYGFVTQMLGFLCYIFFKKWMEKCLIINFFLPVSTMLK